MELWKRWLSADLAASYHLDIFCCLILPGPLLCAHFICLRANIRRSWDGDSWTLCSLVMDLLPLSPLIRHFRSTVPTTTGWVQSVWHVAQLMWKPH